MHQVEDARSAGVRFHLPSRMLAVFVCALVLSGKKFFNIVFSTIFLQLISVLTLILVL